MYFDPPMEQAIFLRRYKRFMADVRLKNGKEITVHCANTGSMKSCLVPESTCWIWNSQNDKRKYPYSLEWVTTETDHLAGINTARPNALVAEAIKEGRIIECVNYQKVEREVKFGEENSRVDFYLSNSLTDKNCYLEVKNVTLATKKSLLESGLGLFPDAVTERGTKHLRELEKVVEDGFRAVLLYCVQHTGIRRVSIADTIDPGYAKALKQASDRGVEIICYQVKMSPEQVYIDKPIKFFSPNL